MVHHDLWDYDATTAPQLVTVRHDGKQVDAVAQSSKQGFLYVFDRVTGKPLWPIEERPVPKSDMPGEQAWPTQPFPTVPPPFARQKMTADDVNPYILTAEERASWKDRIASLRHEGLFTPPSTVETLSIPGARGGSNWGTAASNPSKGMVYLTTQDWPTIYKLSLEDPFAPRTRVASPGVSAGQAVYEQRCERCHGTNGAGSTVGPPRLAGINTRLDLDSFQGVVRSGKAEMPAFQDLDDVAVQELFTFLSAPGSASVKNTLPAGPVVASGGAPGGLDITLSGPRYSQIGGPPYPEGIGAPTRRYYTDWGLYPNRPYVIGPPWSSLVAYDLNSGTIKWKVPLGEDAQAASQGATNTGVFMAEHHGIITTSTGLLFVATTDGKVRAHDTDTGKVLWTGDLPTGSEGMPAMYEVNGRQFLVVPASSGINSGGGHGAPGNAAPATGQTKSYVAFALPIKAAK